MASLCSPECVKSETYDNRGRQNCRLQNDFPIGICTGQANGKCNRDSENSEKQVIHWMFLMVVIQRAQQSARDSARATLWVCLDTGLRLLHPFMPFVTEELWQRLPQPKDTVKKESIVISEYPSAIKSWTNESVEREMELIEAAVKSLRSLKSVLPPKERNERRQAFALCRSEEVAEVIRCHDLDILTLVGLSSLEVLNEGDAAPLGCSVDVVNENISVYLKVKGMINAEVELQKLRKKMEETKRQKDTLEKMMGASGYKEKVRAQIHEENVAKLTKLMQEILSLEEASQHLETDIALENN